MLTDNRTHETPRFTTHHRVLIFIFWATEGIPFITEQVVYNNLEDQAKKYSLRHATLDVFAKCRTLWDVESKRWCVEDPNGSVGTPSGYLCKCGSNSAGPSRSMLKLDIFKNIPYIPVD